MADEDQLEVSSSAPRGKAPAPGGPSPLQAGLLYGGLGAAVAGPAGVLFGLGAGIASAIGRKRFVAKQTQFLNNLDAEYQEAQNNLRDEMEIADPDEKRLLTVGKRMIDDGWNRLGSGDQSGQELWDRGNQIIMGVIQGDISQRKADETASQGMQRDLVSTSAKSLRDEYQQNLTAYSSSTEAANKLLSLTAQKDFDPNKPFYRAALTGLLADSINSFYKDTPSAAGELFAGTGNALQGMGGKLGQAGSVVGDVIKMAGSYINAKEFEVSREDYNRIAMNVLKVAQGQTQQRMGRIDKQGATLDAVARRNGIVKPDYSFQDYITGGVKDLDLLPVQQYTPSYQSTPVPTEQLQQWKKMSPQEHSYRKKVMQQRARPTN